MSAADHRAGVNLPLDEAAVSPHGLQAAFHMGVGRLEAESERRGEALDWGTITFSVVPNIDASPDSENGPAPYVGQLRIMKLVP
jgi:hypothetical protein